MTNREIFISYSTPDKDAVQQVLEFLEGKGYTCFVAYRDIPAGVVWAGAVTDAIEQCRMMIAIYSEAYNSSPQVDREIELCADIEHKPIVTFKLTDTEMKGVKKFFLKNLSWIAMNDDMPSALNQLYHTVIEHIGLPTNSAVIPSAREEKIYSEALTNIQLPSNKFNCYVGQYVTPQMIYQAVGIDGCVFKDEFQGIYDTCIHWWQRNPAVYVMIEDSETQKIVGYINAMPLSDEYYDLIRRGETIDTDVPCDMIETYDFPDTYKLYFSSIAIHPDYHNTSAFKALLDAFMIHMLQLYDREIYFSSILADAVSDVGEKLCKYMGLQYIQDSAHGSKIYEASLIPPSIRPTTMLCKRLISSYRQLYP